MNEHTTALPARHVTVHAAAGTGKTYLLVNRILRLLLAGTAPDAILAITFTRKAAIEIGQRVLVRLWQLAAADDADLDRQLDELGVALTPEHRSRARALHEGLLAAERPLRATTFHAFCQELLLRFPLDAGVAPEFELVEETSELIAAAWRQLLAALAQEPAGPLAAQMDHLLREFGGPILVRQALHMFLERRSDWWAYTETSDNPVQNAVGVLNERLGSPTDAAPLDRLFADNELYDDVAQYAELLVSLGTQTAIKHSEAMHRTLDAELDADARFASLSGALFTKRGGRRKLTISKSARARLGDAASEHFHTLHDRLGDRVAAAREALRVRRTLQLTSAWYACGQALLEHYQHIKSVRAVLDFVDLEWKAYQLLNRSHNAEWIQYKLDQRIDHILVDEFQDTNPTQWRLLLPLLDELVAGDPERDRSVIIVGDSKQSIYGFRRADPRLFHTARDWLRGRAEVDVITQERSWRSAPVIIEFINLVFAEGLPGELLVDFQRHATARHELWGHAELLPLILDAPTPGAARVTTLRDPLLAPRDVAEDRRYEREAAMVVSKIHDLLGSPIGPPHAQTRLRYRDILILIRDRTHADAYEQALQHAGIPYLGIGRGTLLTCLEVRDLIDLLRVLIAPQDDVALAAVLRSPIFACDDENLQYLARETAAGFWRARLAAVAAQPRAPKSLQRADRLLTQWGNLVDRIPVHDLIDRILFEGNVVQRYLAVVATHLHGRIEANLARFAELGLEMDSGRYPSVARFVATLDTARQRKGGGPDEPPPADSDRVRIMTVHSAKGLEAPVVFLVDAARPRQESDTLQVRVDWPVGASRPHGVYLVGAKDLRDRFTRAQMEEQVAAQRRENANLLYVALTRAQQMLFVSGCAPRRGGHGWYGQIEERLRAHEGVLPNLRLRHHRSDDGDLQSTSGALVADHVPAATLPGAPEAKTSAAVIDARLTRPLEASANSHTVYPSEKERPQPDCRLDATSIAAGGQTDRGALIHRLLEQLSQTGAATSRADLKQKLRHNSRGGFTETEFESCWQEAVAVIEAADFRAWFDDRSFDAAFNELPILHTQAGQEIVGVLDRLVVNADEITIIDYKTHARPTGETLEDVAGRFEDQLRLYAQGVRVLWPTSRIRCIVLFTRYTTAIELPIRV